MKTYALCFFLLISITVNAQTDRIQVIDSLNLQSIPFATITSNFNENTITNEEGFFQLKKRDAFSPTDSITISCMGFNTQKIAVQDVQTTSLTLSPKAIDLNAVILTQKEYTLEEIIKKTKENIAEKYNLELSEKSFFMRESYVQEWEKIKLSVKKSSIPAFGQQFWDSIFKTIPKKDSWHTESLGKLYGDKNKESQKLVLERAVNLADTINEQGYDQIENRITSILDTQVKENSYFKFKSGIFSTKVDREEVIEQEKDSIAKDTAGITSFHRARKRSAQKAFSFFHNKEKLELNVLEKSQHYAFILENFTYKEDVPVYHISFQPKTKKGKYKGSMYIDADEFCLIEIEYTNTQNLKDISLLGFSYSLYGKTTKIKFKRFEGKRYQLQLLETTDRFRTGIDRPVKIVEKNKFVKGRRKQNELNGRIDFQINNESTNTFFISGERSIDKKEFETVKENKKFSPAKLHAYSPYFWKGYTIVAPNGTVRSFEVTKE